MGRRLRICCARLARGVRLGMGVDFKGWEEGFGKRGVYCVMGGGAGDDIYDTPFNGNGWVEYRGFECLYANL